MIKTREVIAFTVQGVPVAKQSYRSLRAGGGYRNPRAAAWEQRIGWTSRAVMSGRPPIEGPVMARLAFVLPDHRRVDCDNLSKAVLDGIKKIVITDDCQVIELRITKKVNPHDPCVMVTITPIQEEPCTPTPS